MLVFLFAVCSVKPSVAQIERSDWTYGPVLYTDNFVYWLLADAAVTLPLWCSYDEDVYKFYENNRWWIPEMRYRLNVVQNMEFNGQDATLYPRFSDYWGPKSYSKMNWGIRTFSVGYHVGWLSRIAPIGFDFQADYAQEGYKLKLPESEEKMKITKQMLSATLLAKIRLMKYESNRLNPVIGIGGSYNYALHYKDDIIHDKDAVNNGFMGIVDLGFINTEAHIQWSLRYEHTFYDFYNKDFELDGKKIFEDSNSSFGRIGAVLTYSF